MRPLHLTASNFRSYPSLEIDFRSIRLASITGDNGAGKSSVLKTMNVCIFGAEPSMKLEEYIRKGQEEMKLSFTFDLNGGTYRINRALKHNGKSGKHTLEFQLQNGEEWTPLTGDKIAETQARIDETLCLDQTGFRQSAWISQGDANAFTNALPTARKNVLAGILDLEVYRRLQDAAKKRLRAIEDEIEKLRGKLEHVEVQLEGKALAEAYLAEAQQNARIYAFGIEQLEKELEKLREEETRLAGVKEKAAGLERQMEALSHDASELLGRMDQNISKGESLERLESEVPTLATKSERRTNLHYEIGELDRAATQWHEANKERLELRNKWTEQKAAVDQVASDLTAAEKELERVLSLIAENEGYLTGLAGTKAHNCPTCKQEVKDRALEEARATYERQKEPLGEQHLLANEDVERLSAQLKALKEPLADLVAQGKAIPEVDYDQGFHDGLKVELAGLEGIDAKLAEARSAARQLNEIRKEHEQIKQQIEAKHDERGRLSETLQPLQADLGKLNETIAAIGEKNQALSETRRNHETAAADATRHQAELERLEKLKAESADDRRRQDELQTTAATWRYLVEAFGKDGIPALIIDAAIPEVEDTANDILSRLGTGLEVKLETQKTLKSSDDIRETLDVKIIEDGFERPYETYSGGEAYRVNVALRVALSKLLARRAGAHIETLILDEPEGLDEDGRAKLVELLQILSETFSCILLISHHEDLKEVFPARIECRKTAEGSSAELVIA